MSRTMETKLLFQVFVPGLNAIASNQTENRTYAIQKIVSDGFRSLSGEFCGRSVFDLVPLMVLQAEAAGGGVKECF